VHLLRDGYHQAFKSSSYKYLLAIFCVSHTCDNSIYHKWLSLCAEVKERKRERKDIVFPTRTVTTHTTYTQNLNLLPTLNFKLINVHRRILPLDSSCCNRINLAGPDSVNASVSFVDTNLILESSHLSEKISQVNLSFA